MTALHQYQRLEAAGLWRNGEGAQRREVIIGLRDATIILTDPKTDMPLTQWSLPAIVRISEVAGFVTFASAEDGLETVEIDDQAMIDAFDKVRRAIDRRRRRPGRLRGALVAGIATVIVAGAAIWVPLRLNSFTAARLPDAATAAIGQMALADIQKTTGSPCNSHMGMVGAESLARRIDAANPPDILVLREGLQAPVALPGRMILLPYDIISAAEGPDVLAGLVLAEMTRAIQQDPMQDILSHAGFVATLRLLSSGSLPQGALDGYGLVLPNMPRATLEPALLTGAFQETKITATPYLESQDLAEQIKITDPMPNGSEPIVLDDSDFLGLQYICGT